MAQVIAITGKGEARMAELLQKGFLNISPSLWDEWHILQDLMVQLGKETAISIPAFLTPRNDTITGRLFRKYSEPTKKAYETVLWDLIERGLIKLEGKEEKEKGNKPPFTYTLVKDNG